jgi:dienelactone hydrolase
MEEQIRIEEWTPEQIEEACSFSALIDRMYENRDLFNSCENHLQSIPIFEKWQDQTRTQVIHALGLTELLKNRPAIVKIKGDPDENYETEKYKVEHFYLKSWMDTLIPVYLAIPNGLNPTQKHPAFVVTHGHGQNKAILHGQMQTKEKWVPYAKELTELGIITITMDQWGWAERGFGKRYNMKEGKYALNMLLFGHTINGLRFFDAIRQVDYLLTRSDVDPDRIGIAGLSLGGTTASYTAAIDPRIKLAIIAGYLNTFKASILDIEHCSCNYIPGILKIGEMADIFSLITPRPTCFITGQQDMIFPVDATQTAFSRIQQTYALFGQTQNCILDITLMGHEWRGDVAYPFIQKHFRLK